MTEELFSKWIDDCLTPDEQVIVDAALAEDPSLIEEVESARGLGDLMKSEFPASQEPMYPDFFNSQILNKVAQIDREGAAKTAEKSSPWWARIGFAWVPASGLAAVLAFFAGTKVNPPEQDADFAAATELPNVYTPGGNHKTRVVANAQGEVSVIVVEGLDAIGDDVDFATVGASAVLPERYLISQQRQL